MTLNVEKIKLFLEENNFVPRDASAEGTKFIDKIVATATEEISRHEVFDFQKSKVFELITEENLNLYLELYQVPFLVQILFLFKEKYSV